MKKIVCMSFLIFIILIFDAFASPCVNVTRIFLNDAGIIVFECNGLQHTGIKNRKDFIKIVDYVDRTEILVELTVNGQKKEAKYVLTLEARKNLQEIIGE